MIHYSCDRCGRPIDPHEEARYVVRVEVETVVDGNFEVDDEDRDYLLELHEILERSEATAESLDGEPAFARQRFDLCGECHRKFLKNPVGKETVKQLDFSQN